jgi:hypothetical protein
MPAAFLPVFTLLTLLSTGQPPAAPPPGAPCVACVALNLDAAQAAAVAASGEPLDGVPVVLDDDRTIHEDASRLARAGAKVWVRRVVSADGAVDAPPPGATGVWLAPTGAIGEDALIFALRSASSRLRGAPMPVRIGLVLTAASRTAAVARALAPYLDAVRLPEPSADIAVASRQYAGLDIWIDSRSRDVLTAPQSTAAATIVVSAGSEPARQLRVIRWLGEWMPAGLSALPDVRVACAGCSANVFLHPETLDAIAVVAAPTDGRSTVSIVPAPRRVAMIDAGNPAAPEQLPIHSGNPATVVLPQTSGQVVLDIGGWRGTGEESVYRATVDVEARRTLTAAEIVARHQAQRARQSALVASDIAEGTTVITFEVPSFAGPATIAARTTIFARGPLTEIVQRSITLNGTDMSLGAEAPRLPIIEPERVSALPLAITLSDAYHYTLAGRERANGRDCYVLAFEPAARGGSSFRGRAWIETRRFALVRLEAVQTGLSGAIISSQQRDEYAPVVVDNREVWLPLQSTAYQIYQAAGLRTPIHRQISTPVHRVNARTFQAELEAAHASSAVMLLDTPQGYRYLVRPRESTPSGSPAPRVVAPEAGRRVTTLAFGVIDDPNISVPLPYAGVSYLDFDFLGRGGQVNAFYGGTYGQASWTLPRFLRPGWQLTGRAFGIAVSYNDRAFESGVEQFDQNIRQRPAHADIAVIAPLSARVQLRVGYDIDYTHFGGGDDTAATFLVPADALVHGARLALDLQRGPWTGLVWWNPATRQGWRRWGPDAGRGYDPSTSDYQRYGVTVGRSWVLAPGAVARLDGSWMSGHDLDRFSRYTVDSFLSPLHGYPSASLRFDRGYLVRSVATWTPAWPLRIDGFADCAVVHDPGFGTALRSYPGVGTAVEIPLPKRMLVAVEWSYGFAGRNADGTTGTHVVKVSGFKMF